MDFLGKCDARIEQADCNACLARCRCCSPLRVSRSLRTPRSRAQTEDSPPQAAAAQARAAGQPRGPIAGGRRPKECGLRHLPHHHGRAHHASRQHRAPRLHRLPRRRFERSRRARHASRIPPNTTTPKISAHPKSARSPNGRAAPRIPSAPTRNGCARMTTTFASSIPAICASRRKPAAKPAATSAKSAACRPA